ncbi:MAG: hypothetical protein VKJ44_02770 [Synechococcus sp.]|nr:hypothetical protein [Synechococcus sp.]
MPTTDTTARRRALATLQAHLSGPYTDERCAAVGRAPCRLSDALRAAAVIAPAAKPWQLADLFADLSLWADDERAERYVTGYREGHARGAAEAYRVAS